MRKSLIVILVLMTNMVWAEDAVYLDKDQKSPFSGYLLPQEKLVELRNNTLERDTLKVQNASLNRSLTLQNDIIDHKDQQIKLYSDQNDKLASTAARAESMSTLEKFGLVTLGMVITGLAVYGAHTAYH